MMVIILCDYSYHGVATDYKLGIYTVEYILNVNVERFELLIIEKRSDHAEKICARNILLSTSRFRFVLYVLYYLFASMINRKHGEKETHTENEIEAKNKLLNKKKKIKCIIMMLTTCLLVARWILPCSINGHHQ
jgi:hypothetical protein